MNEIEAWKATGRRAMRIARQRWPARSRALGPLLGIGALLGVATMAPHHAHHAMSSPGGWREGRPFLPGHSASRTVSRTVDRPMGRPFWRGAWHAEQGNRARLAPPALPQAPAVPEAPGPPAVPAGAPVPPAPAAPQAPVAPAAPVAPLPTAP